MKAPGNSYMIPVDAGKVDSPWPEPISAARLCESPPETPPELIKGILYAVGTLLVAGPSKSHKTYTLLDLACAVAHGDPWLGRPTTKTVVLYINLELQGFAVEKRIRQVCEHTNSTPLVNLHMWNLRGQKVTLVDLRARLPDMIKKLGAGLVVIDPLYKVSAVSGMEENSNDSQGQLLATLEEICAKSSTALAICHHFAKGDASGKNAIDRASGGGVFARWGDVNERFSYDNTTSPAAMPGQRLAPQKLLSAKSSAGPSVDFAIIVVRSEASRVALLVAAHRQSDEPLAQPDVDARR